MMKIVIERLPKQIAALRIPWGNSIPWGNRAVLLIGLLCMFWPLPLCAQSQYATSDNLKGYVHWIDLYDQDNQRINPSENPTPYSPEKTCGRCHDFKTIAHGWHFNAASPTKHGDGGRPGQPLIWSDARTGTYMPLSYREWKGAFQPHNVGLTNWQVAAKLGGYLPGVSPDTPQGMPESSTDPMLGEISSNFSVNRSNLTGALSIDCLLCHHRPGSGYSPFVWTEQIAEQNFAYAPTAALGLATVTGNMRRLKDDFNVDSPETRDQLPQLTYEASRFRSDGKVFIDLVRRPTNDACYYCHTELSGQAVQGSRWMHDQDIHLRAGMQCVDCHRNGLDHHMVRGFESENHPAGTTAAALSCQGCHIGSSDSSALNSPNHELFNSPGRMGAPLPAHRGLPLVHFEKLSCTACHSGPAPNAEVPRQILSISHQLGQHIKRSGSELPAIFGNVMLPVEGDGTIIPDAKTGKYTPHKMVWPSYWGLVKNGQVHPLNPEQAYEVLRKPLKVRKDFAAELTDVKLTLAQRRELLGDDRTARLKPEELSEQQREVIANAEEAERTRQVLERMLAALEELEKTFPDSQAVFISGGGGLVRTPEGQLEELSSETLGSAAEPYSWPSAHAVRPARQSLGATGCQECHSRDSAFFFASIQPPERMPGQTPEPIVVHELQRSDINRLTAWAQLFYGRTWFKTFGLVALGLTGLAIVSMFALNLADLFRSRPIA